MKGRRRALTHKEFLLIRPPAQIRTCAANAYGSCIESDAQPLVGVGVADPRFRKKALDQAFHGSPRQLGTFLAPSA